MRRRALGRFMSGCAFAVALAGQTSAQAEPAPEPEAVAPAAPSLEAAFEELRVLSAPVPFDGARYRRDAAYRNERRARVAAATERLRRAAAEFLVKRREALAVGDGRYYRAMAYAWSGRLAEAIRRFEAIEKSEKNRPDASLRQRVLIDWATCAVDHARRGDRKQERGRIKRVERLLKRIEREGIAGDDARRRLDAIRDRLARLELRKAFHWDLEEGIARDRRKALRDAIEEEGIDERGRDAVIEILDGEGRAAALENDAIRRAWTSVESGLREVRRRRVGAFCRAHRDALEDDDGAVFAARAMAIAEDPRAERHFERAVAAARSPRALARVALDFSVFAFDVLRDDAVAGRAASVLFIEDLDDDDRVELARAVAGRAGRTKARTAARAAAVGSAWRGVVRLGGDPTPPVDRNVRVWLFVAPWAQTSRQAVLAFDDARGRIGVDVVGVVPRFGFGWRVRGRRTADGVERFDGDSVAAPLTHDDEAALLATFRDPGRIGMPLVLADGTVAARLGVDRWPTAVVVRGDGTVGAIVDGAALDAVERAARDAAR